MLCPQCRTETNEFNGGQYCPECAVYVIPPSHVDDRALPEFRDLIQPFAQDILTITNEDIRDVLLSLIYYCAEHRYGLSYPAYVPARLLGENTFQNVVAWKETLLTISEASAKVFELLLYYVSERDHKHLDAAARAAAVALDRTQMPLIAGLETKVA